MRLLNKKNAIRRLNQCESVKQRYLRYGLAFAEEVADIFFKHGYKGLRKVDKKLQNRFKIRVV